MVSVDQAGKQHEKKLRPKGCVFQDLAAGRTKEHGIFTWKSKADKQDKDNSCVNDPAL